MIYASIRTGKVITNKAILARVETNPDVKEIKVPDNNVCGDIFKLGTRARFKVVGNGKHWAKLSANYASA